MKQIILSMVLLFSMSSLFSQEVFKLGIVKGKNVTYEVKESKDGHCWWTVSNIHNPDTTTRRGPVLVLRRDILLSGYLQIGQIVRDHLTRDELLELSKKNRFCDIFSVKLRIDWQAYKVLQVVCFRFGNLYAGGMHVSPEVRRERGYYPDHYDGFWLNFDPDRLHEIEKDIVKRFKVPELNEETLKVFRTQDLEFSLSCDKILEVEKVIKKEKKWLEQERKEWEEIRKEEEKRERKEKRKEEGK